MRFRFTTFGAVHKVALLRLSYCCLAVSRVCVMMGIHPLCFECVSIGCDVILAWCHWNGD